MTKCDCMFCKMKYALVKAWLLRSDHQLQNGYKHTDLKRYEINEKNKDGFRNFLKK
ncbi:hypothetical protein J32TS6_19100 [Virgibacillus pantothenticus]|nr:hypothetical protein J32TS6_19100 [Virgibacillus pantothenticus]